MRSANKAERRGRRCARLVVAVLSLGLPPLVPTLALGAPSPAAYGDPRNGAVPVARERRASDGARLTFPGAFGDGRFADVGIGPGQGFAVVKVTSLADTTASGTLRHCLQVVTGPRVCVFTVSGWINVNSRLVLSRGQVMIAGQTSPGGVGLRWGSSTRQLLEVWAPKIVMRHINLAPGLPRVPVGDGDSLAVTSERDYGDLYLDHLGLFWSVDEALSTSNGNGPMTVAWSVISEPLNCLGRCRTDGKPHAYGPLFKGVRGLTYAYNFMSNGENRWPNVDSEYPYDTDIVGNVIFNVTGWPIMLMSTQTDSIFNVVNNYIIRGPSPGSGSEKEIQCFAEGTSGNGYAIHLSGNRGYNDRSGTTNIVGTPGSYSSPIMTERNTVGPVRCASLSRGNAETLFLTPRGDGIGAPLVPADQAARDVMAWAGPWSRNGIRSPSVRRVVDGARSCTGKTIAAPADVGGYPAMTGTAWTDSDSDGMDDAWEMAVFGNLAQKPNGDPDGDDWSNVEEWLAGLAKDDRPTLGTGTGSVPAVDCGA